MPSKHTYKQFIFFVTLLLCTTVYANSESKLIMDAVMRGEKDKAIGLINKLSPTQLNYPFTRNGGTLLHMVVSWHTRRKASNSYAVITALLERGADPNLGDNEQRTPLFYLSRRGDLAATIKLLIKYGAKMEASDITGLTALSYYAKTRNTAAISALLKVGVDPSIRGKFGATPLMGAAKGRDLGVVKQLVSAGADITASDQHGNGVLHSAARNGDVAMIDYFIGKGLSIDTKNKYGIPPLSIMTTYKHWAAARLMLERGADPLVPVEVGASPKNRESVAVHLLLHPELGLSELIKSRNLDISAHLREHPEVLYQVLENRDVSSLETLISLGVDVNARVDYKPPAVPLLSMYNPDRWNQVHTLLRLVLDNGADVNAKDMRSRQATGIYYATVSGYTSTVRLLLSYGADISYRDDKNYVFSVALKREQYDTVQQILESDAELDYQDVDLWVTLGKLTEKIGNPQSIEEDLPATIFTTFCLRHPIIDIKTEGGAQIYYLKERLLRKNIPIVTQGLANVMFVNLEALPISESVRKTMARPPMPVVRKKQILRSYPREARLHAIGIYKGEEVTSANAKPWWAECKGNQRDPKAIMECHKKKRMSTREQTVNVSVYSKSKPLILALTAYEPVHWVISNLNNAKIDGIVLAGYHGQRVSGIAPGTPVDVYTYEPSSCGSCTRGEGHFYAYKKNTPKYKNTVSQLKKLTGREPSSFQVKHKEKSFSVIDQY